MNTKDNSSGQSIRNGEVCPLIANCVKRFDAERQDDYCHKDSWGTFEHCPTYRKHLRNDSSSTTKIEEEN